MRSILPVILGFFASSGLWAADLDWPQWRGPGRSGHWAGTLPHALPKTLVHNWVKPIGGGFGGVSIVGERIYVMDRQTKPREVERILCLKLDSGEPAWVHEYPVKYGGLDYGNGPRSTPTVHDGRVYTLGAVGHVHCLDAATGKVHWMHDGVARFKVKLPTWGLACSPLIDGERLLVQIGADDGTLMAFDRRTGAVAWKCLNDRAGYAAPIRIDVGKSKLVIMWTAEHVHGIDANDGKRLWSVPFKVTYDVAISDPVWHDGILLCGQYWEGSLALKLDANGLNPAEAWSSRKLRLLMATPLLRDGYAYCLERENGLMCVEMKSGKVMWDGYKISYDRRNPHASLTWCADGLAMMVNEKGELIRAKLSPQRYEEAGRSKVFEGSWSHPGFARGVIVARDDKQIVSARLD